MAKDEDQFDPKTALPVEGLTKSEFQRWLMDQDSLVKFFVVLLHFEKKL